LQSTDLFRVFCVYPPPPSARKFVEGVVYIVDFKSIHIRIAEERGEKAHKVESEPHHMAKKWDHKVGHLSHLVTFHIDFFFHHVHFLKKNGPKRLDQFDIRKVSKYAKHEFLF
jgi:hypothetical protein